MRIPEVIEKGNGLMSLDQQTYGHEQWIPSTEYEITERDIFCPSLSRYWCIQIQKIPLQKKFMEVVILGL